MKKDYNSIIQLFNIFGSAMKNKILMKKNLCFIKLEKRKDNIELVFI